MENNKNETPLVEGGQGRSREDVFTSSVLVGVLIALAIVLVVLLLMLAGGVS